MSGDLSQCSVSAASNGLAVDRRRVPWDNRGTSFHSGDFFLFARLRFLEPGSIPAASTISCVKTDTYVAGFSFEALGRLGSPAGAPLQFIPSRLMTRRSVSARFCLVSVAMDLFFFSSLLARRAAIGPQIKCHGASMSAEGGRRSSPRAVAGSVRLSSEGRSRLVMTRPARGSSPVRADSARCPGGSRRTSTSGRSGSGWP
jgi:hypothetical protein